MRKKVLFIDRVHLALKQTLTEKGFECVEHYQESYEAVIEEIKNYHGLVVRSRIPIDKNLIDSSKNLEWIARSGAGLENIDMEAAKAAQVAVYNSPEGNMDAVGEHALGMLLALFTRLPKADREVRAGVWEREDNRGIELGNRTVGIIGFGHTGSAFAKKLSGLGCRILAFDKYKKDYAPDYVEETTLEKLKAESDIISIHLPLSKETDGYVNRQFIHSCEKPFFLINTARGRHVVTDDLIEGMEESKILGACLDVLEFEKSSFDLHNFNEMPTAFKRLAESENVILTPHVAGWTRESYRKLSEILAEKILNNHGS